MKRHIEDEFPELELMDRYDFIIVDVRLREESTKRIVRLATASGRIGGTLMERLGYDAAGRPDSRMDPNAMKVLVAEGTINHHTIHNQVDVTVHHRSSAHPPKESDIRPLLSRIFPAIPMTVKIL